MPGNVLRGAVVTLQFLSWQWNSGLLTPASLLGEVMGICLSSLHVNCCFGEWPTAVSPKESYWGRRSYWGHYNGPHTPYVSKVRLIPVFWTDSSQTDSAGDSHDQSLTVMISGQCLWDLSLWIHSGETSLCDASELRLGAGEEDGPPHEAGRRAAVFKEKLKWFVRLIRMYREASFGGFPGISNWEEIPGLTQNSVEG